MGIYGVYKLSSLSPFAVHIHTNKNTRSCAPFDSWDRFSLSLVLYLYAACIKNEQRNGKRHQMVEVPVCIISVFVVRYHEYAFVFLVAFDFPKIASLSLSLSIPLFLSRPSTFAHMLTTENDVHREKKIGCGSLNTTNNV